MDGLECFRFVILSAGLDMLRILLCCQDWVKICVSSWIVNGPKSFILKLDVLSGSGVGKFYLGFNCIDCITRSRRWVGSSF